MADSHTKVEVSISTLRWVISGGFLLMGAIIKLEFNRIWNKVDENNKNIEDNKIQLAKTNVDTSLETRIKALEEARLQQRDKDKELYKRISEMNEKLHKHIESAIERKETLSTQTLRKILSEEITKIKIGG